MTNSESPKKAWTRVPNVRSINSRITIPQDFASTGISVSYFVAHRPTRHRRVPVRKFRSRPGAQAGRDGHRVGRQLPWPDERPRRSKRSYGHRGRGFTQLGAEAGRDCHRVGKQLLRSDERAQRSERSGDYRGGRLSQPGTETGRFSRRLGRQLLWPDERPQRSKAESWPSRQGGTQPGASISRPACADHYGDPSDANGRSRVHDQPLRRG